MIVMLGQSGQGKSTFMNALAMKQLAITNKNRGQTSEKKNYQFERKSMMTK